jgi:hypothetical protein
MVNMGRVEGRATVALRGRGVKGQHADAKAEAGADFSRSRALVRGSVSSHAKAGRHVQLSKRACALCPFVVLASRNSCRRSHGPVPPAARTRAVLRQ